MVGQVDRVNGLVGTLGMKAPCRAASTGNLTLSGEQTVDGVALVEWDRVLVKDQTTASENGIYDVQLGAWTRSADFNGPRDVMSGTTVPVGAEGTANGKTFWFVETTGDITPGTTSLAFAVSPAAPMYSTIHSATAKATPIAADEFGFWDSVSGLLRKLTWANLLTALQASLQFLQAGTGAVARSMQGKMREAISVTDFGAVGDGVTDDTVAIQAAIDYVESLGGGKVCFPQGTFIVSTTLTINDHGVSLVGEGEGHFYSTVSSITTATPATVLKYAGGSALPVIELTTPAGSYKKSGGGVENIFIHCGSGAGVASHGVMITSRDKATVRNVTIFNPTVAQLETRCYSGTLANPANGYDVQHCLFENVCGVIDSANTTAKGLRLTGGQGNGGAGQGNTSFNTFINTRWQGTPTTPAVEIGDTDNNTFIALRANGGGTEEPITVGAIEFLSADETNYGAARYNNIMGCEAVGGIFARASQTGGASSFRNNVFGYNISNGGIAPLIQAGAGGSSNATLAVYYYDRMYAPLDLVLPETGTLSFDATSASLADSRTVSSAKLSLCEHGNLAAGAVYIEGTTTAGVQTSSVSTGHYTRVGRLIFVNIQITWSAHTGTGNMRVVGLPFTSLDSARPQILSVTASNLAYTAGNYLAAHVEQNAKTMLLKQVAPAGAIADVPMDTAGTLYISGCYQAA